MEKLEVADGDLKTAVEQYLDEASDTLKLAFDRAFRIKKAGKYDNCRLIVEALADLPQEGATHTEIIGRIRRSHSDYPAGNLTHYLRQLQNEDRGALIRHDVASGRFSFADPIYRAFALASIKKGAAFAPEIRIQFGVGGVGKDVFANTVAQIREHLFKRLTELKEEKS